MKFKIVLFFFYKNKQDSFIQLDKVHRYMQYKFKIAKNKKDESRNKLITFMLIV